MVASEHWGTWAVRETALQQSQPRGQGPSKEESDRDKFCGQNPESTGNHEEVPVGDSKQPGLGETAETSRTYSDLKNRAAIDDDNGIDWAGHSDHQVPLFLPAPHGPPGYSSLSEFPHS